MNSFYPRIPTKRVNQDAPLPTYAHDGDAGMDLCSMEDVTLWPGETVTVKTGIAMAIPKGWAGFVFPRSGLGSRGLTLSNCVGVIDSTYRGEIGAPLHNNHPTHKPAEDARPKGLLARLRELIVRRLQWQLVPNNHPIAVHKGDRVCQIVFLPVGQATLVETDELDETERSDGGFGSTGTGTITKGPRP